MQQAAAALAVTQKQLHAVERLCFYVEYPLEKSERGMITYDKICQLSREVITKTFNLKYT